MANNVNKEITGWVGWIYFAAFLLVLLGFFQAVAGLTALLNNKFYVAEHGRLLVLNFTQWGWIDLIFGVVVIMVGTSLFHGAKWARLAAVFLVALNLLMQFSFVSVYPIWSVIVMVIDVLILYAITVHGGELSQSN